MDAPALYNCTGLDEHGRRCGKLLFVFKKPDAPAPDLGQVEVKCRRCKTINYFRLADASPLPLDVVSSRRGG